MTRRRLLWLAVAVVLGALALAVAFETGLLRWPWGSPEVRARAVRVGMTEREVDAVLGGPPGIKAPWADPEKGEPFRAGMNPGANADTANQLQEPAIALFKRR